MRLKRVVSENRKIDRLGYALGLLLLGCAGSHKPATPVEDPVPELGDEGDAPKARATASSSPRVREAEALLQKGDAVGARNKFEGALAETPRDTRAWLGLGLAYEALGDGKQAERAYRSAIEVDAQFAEGHNNLGLLLRDRGDDAGAIAAFQRAVEADPKLASAHANLALAFEDAGRGDEAARAYRKASELAPKDAMLRANHGLFLLGRDDTEGARSELRAALASAQGDRAALVAVGNGLRRAGKPDEAVRALRSAIAAGDGKATPALLSELALAQNAAGDDAGAKGSLNEALALDGRYATAHYLLGSIEASAGNGKAAKSHYEKCIQLEPRGPLAAKAKEKLAALKQTKK
jgi:Tfp pilus assembly protein PilF